MCRSSYVCARAEAAAVKRVATAAKNIDVVEMGSVYKFVVVAVDIENVATERERERRKSSLRGRGGLERGWWWGGQCLGLVWLFELALPDLQLLSSHE